MGVQRYIHIYIYILHVSSLWWQIILNGSPFSMTKYMGISNLYRSSWRRHKTCASRVTYLDSPICLLMVSHCEQLSPMAMLRGGYVYRSVWKQIWASTNSRLVQKTTRMNRPVWPGRQREKKDRDGDGCTQCTVKCHMNTEYVSHRGEVKLGFSRLPALSFPVLFYFSNEN